MGFYGNISSANRSSFQFDKIYKNRHAMDLNAATDGVFIGRYVLVDYDQEVSLSDIKTAVGEGSDVENIVNQIKTITNTKSKVVFGYQLCRKVTQNVEDEETGEITPKEVVQPIEPTTLWSGLDINYIRVAVDASSYAPNTYYYYDISYQDYLLDDSANFESGKKYYLPQSFVVVDNPSNSNELTNGDFVVVIGKVITYTEEVVVGEEQDINAEGNPAPTVQIKKIILKKDKHELIEDKKDYKLYVAINNGFELATDANAANLVNNGYLTNYQEDSNIYSATGRGYDSTVWQKTYKDGDVKYVMIAELNSVVPSFDLSIDAPTPVPLKPHFDTDSSNVYYKIHLQPSWGLRVKKADIDFDFSDGIKLPSDIKGDYYTGNTITPNPQDDNYINHHTVTPESIPNTNLAIYFNKAGFNRFVEQEPDYKTDEITVLPTGKSLNDYYVTNNGDTYGKSEDTYELSMMLPSIGASISDFWNIVYGPGTYKDSNGNYLWDKITQKFADEKTEFKVRNTALEWNTTEGRRAVKQVGNSYTYNIDDLNTVAGVVNSLHDLMGMIIRISSSISEVNSWDADKIYFVPDIVAIDYIKTLSYNKDDIVKIPNKYKYYKALSNIIVNSETNENPNPEDAKNDIYWEQIDITGKYYYKQKTYQYTEVSASNDQPVYYDVANVVNLLPFTQTENANTGEIVAQYFRKSEEQYDSYKDFYETETPVDDRIVYNYNNYYAVKDDDDINLNAVYGKLELEKPTDLSPENYIIPSNEEDILSANVYYIDEGTSPLTYILAQEEKPTHNFYYRINFKKVPKEEQKTFYIRNIFWMGTKNFTSAQEKAGWKRSFNGREMDPINSTDTSLSFDTLAPCTQNATQAWLNELKEINENDNNLKYYAFYQGIEIDSQNSQFTYVDTNLVSDSIPLSNVSDTVPEGSGYYKSNGFYYYKAQKAGLEELLTSARESNGSLYFQCGQYLNQKSGKVETTDLDNTLHTLMAWEGSSLTADEMELTPIKALERTISRPVYTFKNVSFIPINNIALVNEDGTTGYWFKASLGANVIGYQQETAASLAAEQGRGRRDRGEWYVIDGEKTVLVYYDLKGEYYYKSGDNWIRETATMLRSDTNINKYYKVKSWTPLESNQVPFKKNTYYKMVNGSLQPITTYDPNIDRYYINKDRYVIEDTNGNFQKGTIWNPDIETPDKNESGITLGYRKEKFEARELDGFAKYLNTLHGLILEINKKLLFDDELTRDTSTVQGAINKLNDLIRGFAGLLPGDILMVDALGRIHSGDWDTKQKSSTNLGAAPAIPAGELEDTDDGRWIRMTMTPGTAENGYKPHIKLEHTFKKGTNTSSTLDLNSNDPDIDKNNIELYTPILDNMGHVVAKNTKTVTLPYGFKTIAVDNSTNLIATTTQDTLSINSGNDWINLTGNGKTLTLTHSADLEGKEVGYDTDTDIHFGDTLKGLQIERDDAGHITTLEEHNLQLPDINIWNFDLNSGQPSQIITDNNNNVVTSLSFNTTNQRFDVMKRSVGNLSLTGYTPITSGDFATPSNSDNVNTAIAKIMRILGNNTSLTTGEPEENEVLTKVSLQNGQLSGSYIELGTAAYANATAFELMGAAENVRTQLIGEDTDTDQDLTLKGIKKYVNALISQNVVPDQFWGVQMGIANDVTLTSDIAWNGVFSDNGTQNISLDSDTIMSYGVPYYSIETKNITGTNEEYKVIKIGTSGLYKIHGSVVAYIPENSIVKAWIVKNVDGIRSSINGVSEYTGAKEPYENNGQTFYNTSGSVILSFADKLVHLDAGDEINLVAGCSIVDASTKIKKNDLTYLLLEMIKADSNNGGE